MAPNSSLNARNNLLGLKQEIYDKFHNPNKPDYASRLTAKYSVPPYLNEYGNPPEEETMIDLEAKSQLINRGAKMTPSYTRPNTRKRAHKRYGGRRKSCTHKRRTHKRNHRRTHRR